MANLAALWVNIIPSVKGLKAAVANAAAGVDSKGVGSKMGADISNGMTTGLTKIGGLLASASKKVAGLATVALPGVGALTKAALDGYSDYEQLSGGIQKLYGNMGMSLQDYAAQVGKATDAVAADWQRNEQAQSIVMKNAAQAYKTAGMSANDYMQQATTISAALINSLGGDTVKAANYVDIAMRAVSDNVNTFGSNAEDVQNAIKGIAKQNYTMLDNLNLGYAGTKQGMQDLIDDANKWGAANGEASNLSIDSFADCVQAIQQVQEAQHIAGTTSREAATTIEGSINSAKAAWANWLSEMGKDDADMAGLTKELFDSIQTAASNVMPRLGEISKGAFAGIADSAKALQASLPAPFKAALNPVIQFATNVANGNTSLKDIAKSLTGMAGGLATFIAVGGNVKTIMGAVNGVGKALGGLPKKAQTAGKGIQDAFNGISGIGKRFGSAFSEIDMNFGGLASAAKTGIGNALTQAGSTVGGLFDRYVGGPLGSAASSIGGKIAAPFQALGGKAAGFLSPVTSAFDHAFKGFGGQVGSAAQSALGSIGGIFTNFFSPANFLKYFGLAAIAAALIVGLGALVQSSGGAFVGQINAFFTTTLPGILTAVQAWITANLPTLLNQGVAALTAILNGISTAMPSIIGTAALILTTLVNGLAQNLPILLPAAMNVITSLVANLALQAGPILSAGMNLLSGLVQGIIGALPNLIAAAPTIIGNLVSGIAANLPSIMTSGMNLLLTLVNGIIGNLPNLIAAVPRIIASFVNGISGHLGEIISTGFKLLGQLGVGIVNAIPKLMACVPQIFSALVGAFRGIDWARLGKNIIDGVVNGVKSFGGQIIDAVLSAAKGAFDGVKKFFGIHSPSRLMRDQVGKYVALGMAEGITDYADSGADAMTAAARGIVSAGNDGLADFDPQAQLTADLSKTGRLSVASDLGTTLNIADKLTPRQMTAADFQAAMTAAIQTMPNPTIVMDTGVVAGAVNRRLGTNMNRGL